MREKKLVQVLTEVVSVEGCVESGRDLTAARIAVPILLLTTGGLLELLLTIAAMAAVSVMLLVMASWEDEWSEPRS